MQLRQMAKARPGSSRSEIDRKIIELMDSQWINRSLQSLRMSQADQQEDQAIENSVMLRVPAAGYAERRSRNPFDHYGWVYRLDAKPGQRDQDFARSSADLLAAWALAY